MLAQAPHQPRASNEPRPGRACPAQARRGGGAYLGRPLQEFPGQLGERQLALKVSTRPRLKGAPGRFDRSVSFALHGAETSAAVGGVIWNVGQDFHP